MDEYITILSLNIVNITIFLVMYYLNRVSNKGIYFGVRIPKKYENELDLKVLEKSYKKISAIIMIISTIILNSILLGAIKYSGNIFEIITLIASFGMIFIYEIQFIMYYKKVKVLKVEKGWNVKSNNVVVVDTTLRKPKKNEKIKQIPTKYFAMLLIVPITLFLLTFIKAKSLPEIVILPVGGYGEFNKATLKGIMILYQNIFAQLFSIVIFIGINKSMISSRVDLDSGSIGVAVERKKKFRQIGSIFMLITAIQVTIIGGMAQLSILYGFEINIINYIMTVVMLVTMVIFIIYFIKIGQGGRNININININNDNEDDDLYKDDDSKWILGSIYYNKNDPAMMIEKRVGIGWTINFANPKAIIFIVVFLVIILSMTVLGIKMV